MIREMPGSILKRGAVEHSCTIKLATHKAVHRKGKTKRGIEKGDAIIRAMRDNQAAILHKRSQGGEARRIKRECRIAILERRKNEHLIGDGGHDGCERVDHMP